MRTFRDILAERLTKAEITEVERWVADESLKINLQKVRDLVGMSQAEMAAKLKMSQSALSRAETSVDPKLSTVRRHVEALGGKVEIRAVFADKSVKLDL
jgi:predicted transcriptional regulator